MMRCVPFAAILAFAAAPALAAQPVAAVDTGRVYAPEELSSMPSLVNVDELRGALAAGYPPELRAAGVEGTVAVSLVVNRSGTPEEIRVVQSTHPAFDSVTLATAAGLRFTAAMVDGQRVRTRVQVPVQWRMDVSAEQAARAPAPESGGEPADQALELDEVPVPQNDAYVRDLMANLYPPQLLSEGEGGEVILRLHMDEQGSVLDAGVETSTHPALRDPSLAVARELVFSPPRAGGTPVQVWTLVRLRWEADARERGPVVGMAARELADTYELSQVDEFPRPLNVPDLQRALERLYPPEVRYTRQGGTTQLRFRVDEHGRVGYAQVTQTSSLDFNLPAIRAIRHLRFQPGRLGGRPVAVWVELPIQWSVNQ